MKLTLPVRMRSSRALVATIFLASLAGCGGADPSDPARSSDAPIIGGTVDAHDDAVVALVTTGNGRVATCTGEIIAPNVVLTAAHCVHPKFINLALYGQFTDANVGPYTQEVVVGTDDGSPKARLAVASAQYNPAYDTSLATGTAHADDDVGIVVLKAPTTIAPVVLNRDAADVKNGEAVRIVGYGMTVDGDNTKVGIKNEGNAHLEAYSAKRVIVRGSASQCHGDSGGPAFVTVGGVEKLVAITSSTVTDDGTNCPQGLYNTRIDAELSFIDGVLAQHGGSPTPAPGPGPGPGPGPSGDCGSTVCTCADGATDNLSYCGIVVGNDPCAAVDQQFGTYFPGFHAVCTFDGGPKP